MLSRWIIIDGALEYLGVLIHLMFGDTCRLDLGGNAGPLGREFAKLTVAEVIDVLQQHVFELLSSILLWPMVLDAQIVLQQIQLITLFAIGRRDLVASSFKSFVKADAAQVQGVLGC